MDVQGSQARAPPASRRASASRGAPASGEGTRQLEQSTACPSDRARAVPFGDDGGFRFFAAPGDRTLRVLAPGGVRLEQSVTADIGHVTTVEFAV